MNDAPQKCRIISKSNHDFPRWSNHISSETVPDLLGENKIFISFINNNVYVSHHVTDGYNSDKYNGPLNPGKVTNVTFRAFCDANKNLKYP
jgi:hypothetical protein